MQYLTDCRDLLLGMVERVGEIGRLARYSTYGLTSLATEVEKTRLLQWGQQAEHPEQHALELEEAAATAAYAKAQLAAGFPDVQAAALVSYWSALEAFVEDLAVLLLDKDPDALRLDSVSAVKVSLSDYESLDREERLRLVVRELSRTSKADLRQGATKLNAVLEMLGVSGSLDEATRRTLFEMGHVRNVVVHRAGVADRRLVDNCPWLSLSRGAQVILTRRDTERFEHATFQYLRGLWRQLHDRANIPWLERYGW